MTAGRAASFAILDRFVECGGGMIDTADVYSAWVPGHTGGESEAMMGAWLKASGARDRVLIATKVGMGEGGLKPDRIRAAVRSEEHTSELQSLMCISYAVFCLKKKRTDKSEQK